MIVDSKHHEFGYELLSALPYAKWLSDKGELTGTISGVDTKCLYYFSKNHKEVDKPRSWYNNTEAVLSGLPNIKIHQPSYDFSKFSNPDFKKKYANNEFIYDKPIVCICNRKNSEWERGAINYFDLSILAQMFDLLKDKYKIIYFNIEGRKELYDNAPPESFGDFEFIRENYPEVTIIHDLVKKYSFNETQLRVFANCEHFITMNGGYSILSAFFGGKNIIFSKYCREIGEGENAFNRWYPKLGGQQVKVTRNYAELLRTIKYFYVDELPTVNILVRTNNRPNYFNQCMDSIYMQDYKNINVLVGIDDIKSDYYTIKHKCTPVYYDKIERKDGKHFPYNLYFNEMYKYCKDGFVMFLDDDDELNGCDAISKIVEQNKDLLLWRVEFNGGRIVPSDANYGGLPVECDVSGIGFAFKTKYLQDAFWDDGKRGDFRLISKLYSKINNKSWINCIFTKIQHMPGNGNRIDLIKYDNKMEKQMFIVKINGITQALNGRDAINLESKGVCEILKKEDKIKVEVYRDFNNRKQSFKVGINETDYKTASLIVDSNLGKIVETFEKPIKLTDFAKVESDPAAKVVKEPVKVVEVKKSRTIRSTKTKR